MLGIKVAIGHYNIGVKDGVNTVLKRNIKGIVHDLKKDIHVSLFGSPGPDIEEFINQIGSGKVDYINLPEFASGYNDRNINEQKAIDYMYEGEKIADKLVDLLDGYDLIIMENTTVGNHPALIYGLHIYTKWCMNHDVHKRFIFRTHDFMQDRPVNFRNVKKFQPRRSRYVPDWHTIFYPNLPNIYYMAINTTSMRELYSHGIDEETIYYLPNSIDDNLQVPDERYKGMRDEVNKRFGLDKDTKIIYYPVRCVPRKNIEEAILLTVLINRISNDNIDEGLKNGAISGKYHLMISLDNNDPKTGVYAEKIKEYVKKFDLPVTVGFGDLVNLEREYNDDGTIRNYGIADAYAISEIVVTTSILEGFGFVYIEPWMVDCLVIGRNLPNVTQDFAKWGGLELGHLYDVLITDDDVDFRFLGMEQDILGTTFNSLNLNSLIAKMNYINKIREDDKALKRFISHNSIRLSSMFSVLSEKREKQLIEHNKSAVQRHYSREAVAQRLYEIMLEVMTRS